MYVSVHEHKRLHEYVYVNVYIFALHTACVSLLSYCQYYELGIICLFHLSEIRQLEKLNALDQGTLKLASSDVLRFPWTEQRRHFLHSIHPCIDLAHGICCALVGCLYIKPLG